MVGGGGEGGAGGHNKFVTKPLAVKTIYKKSTRAGNPYLAPAPTLGYYILALNPSTVSDETASVVRSFQFAIVWVGGGCGVGGGRVLKTVRINVRMMILKEMGPGSPVPSTGLRKVPLSYLQ